MKKIIPEKKIKNIDDSQQVATKGFVSGEFDDLARMCAVQFADIDMTLSGHGNRLNGLEQAVVNLSLEVDSLKKEVRAGFSEMRGYMSRTNDILAEIKDEMRSFIVIVRDHESRITGLEKHADVLESF